MTSASPKRTKSRRVSRRAGGACGRWTSWDGFTRADDRIGHGFTFRSVLAEFRALRATVLRRYAESGATDLADVRRFNEAIDEAMTESMDRFSRQTDLFRDQFVGVLSHDLRTPLGVITAGAALLAGPEDNPQRRNRVVERMMNSAQRMERMIGDLLDLTRVRLGGAMPLKRRPADLQQLCEETLVEIRAVHPDADVRVDCSGDLRGEWDTDRLAQVLSNLVSNAIQHGHRTRVTIAARDKGDSVSLAIHNAGAAIPADLLPTVFEPLARASEEGTPGSIGLGLFIARTIVMAHGGDVQVSSSAGAGTTFTVALPKAAR